MNSRFIFLIVLFLFQSCVSKKEVSMEHLSYLTQITGDQALSFAREQNKISEIRLKKDPRYSTTYKKAFEILNSKDKLPGIFFIDDSLYNFWQDDVHIRGILRRTSMNSFNSGKPAWITVLDVDHLAKAENQNWVYKGLRCLQSNYEFCTIALSDGGKDAVTYREFNLSSLQFVKDGFVLPESKSSLSWLDKDTLLIGDGIDANSLTTSGYPSVVKVLKRGQKLADAPVLFKGNLSSVYTGAYSFFVGDNKKITLLIENTKFYEQNSYLVDVDKMKLTPIKIPSTSYIADYSNEYFIVYLRKAYRNFPAGSLIAIHESNITKENATVQLLFQPSETEFFEYAHSTKDFLFVGTLQDVKERVFKYELKSGQWIRSTIEFGDKNGSQTLGTTSSKHNHTYFSYTDFLSPRSVYFKHDDNPVVRKVMQSPAFFDSTKYKVEQLKAKSKDGTLIPYFMVSSKKTVLDGNNPTLIEAYGGFEVSRTPEYLNVTGSTWLEQGGIYVLANLRGGGEYGPAWHAAGLRQNRYKIFEDFYAVAEDLFFRKITSPSRLGIKGGSNGGLLTAVALTQRPELYSAVISEVPLTNMLEYHRWLAGASWIEEYGNPDDSKMHEYLKSYSPLHNLKKEKQYPEAFFLTSTKDDRVHPAHARQMVARMLELGYPVLYHENLDGGHGRATNTVEMAEFMALEFTYLYQKLMNK